MSDIHVTLTEMATVMFYDEQTNKTDAYYEVQIIVKTLMYSTGVEYYDIGYTYKFHLEELEDPDDILHYRKVIHPFYKENQDGRQGEIIKKNRMTTAIVEFLLMPDPLLAKEIGMTTPQRYRLDIIHSLARMWD
jgi:hypothetical protein